MNTSSRVVPPVRTAVLVRRTITVTVFVIAGLAFAFGFTNGLAVGLALGVPPWGSVLVAPAVDLSVVALLATIQFLRARGASGHLVSARLLVFACGLITFALNIARPILQHAYGRACFDGIAPFLLLGWSEVAPRLLLLLHTPSAASSAELDGATSADCGQQDESRPAATTAGPSAELVLKARELDAAKRTSAGKPISRDQLRAALSVSNALAGELVRIVRTAEGGADG